MKNIEWQSATLSLISLDPKTFLLKKIINYKTNGLESLGQLNAKHIDDIGKIMDEYAIAVIKKIIEREKSKQ